MLMMLWLHLSTLLKMYSVDALFSCIVSVFVWVWGGRGKFGDSLITH